MIIFFNENFTKKNHHFDDRYEERVEMLNLDRKMQNIFDENLKNLYLKAPRFDSLAYRILKLPRKKHYVDKQGEKFYGDEVWIIIKNGNLATLLIRDSSRRQTSKSLNVKNIVYGSDDLKKLVIKKS